MHKFYNNTLELPIVHVCDFVVQDFRTLDTIYAVSKVGKTESFITRHDTVLL